MGLWCFLVRDGRPLVSAVGVGGEGVLWWAVVGKEQLFGVWVAQRFPGVVIRIVDAVLHSSGVVTSHV